MSALKQQLSDLNQKLFGEFNAYYSTLNAREQLAVRLMAWILFFGLLYVVFHMSHSKLEQASLKLEEERVFQSWLLSQHDKLKPSQSLRSLAEEANLTATQTGIQSEISQLSETEINILLSHSDYAVLANFLTNMQQKGYAIKSYHFNQKADFTMTLQAEIISDGG